MDKKIIAGKPVIRGTRIPVSLLLNLLSRGYTVEKICKAYPQLKPQDIKAALEYAGAVTKRDYELRLPRIVTNV